MGNSEEQAIGIRIRNWVKENYSSAKEFSRITGIKYTTVNNWFNGNREPNWAAINQLLELGFDCGFGRRRHERPVIVHLSN